MFSKCYPDKWIDSCKTENNNVPLHPKPKHSAEVIKNKIMKIKLFLTIVVAIAEVLIKNLDEDKN